MELRFSSARATKDIDLTCLHRIKNVESPIEALILHELRQLVKIDLGDYFNFEISSAQMDLENAPYGGSRYSVSSFIDRRLFVRFQLDIGADAILDNIENIDGSDWLKYCGIKAPKIKMISVEQQLAEKIHAYTFPRENRLNSKVKDLVDMLLLIELRKVDIEDFKKIIKNVFRTRKTHMLPSFLNPPPSDWELLYKSLSAECGIKKTMSKAFDLLEKFYISLEISKLVNKCFLIGSFIFSFLNLTYM